MSAIAERGGWNRGLLQRAENRSSPAGSPCPAFPANARSVYQGYLFVGGTLLNESGMEHHPLTPMTDANLVRVLQPQTKHKVGLVAYDVVARGAQAILCPTPMRLSSP